MRFEAPKRNDPTTPAAMTDAVRRARKAESERKRRARIRRESMGGVRRRRKLYGPDGQQHGNS